MRAIALFSEFSHCVTSQCGLNRDNSKKAGFNDVGLGFRWDDKPSQNAVYPPSITKQSAV
jgi:hypothetical protein